MTKSALIGAAVLALTITAAAAQDVDTDSANYVMPGCLSVLDGRAAVEFRQGVCAGIIRGISGMGSVMKELLQKFPRSVDDNQQKFVRERCA
jgi:hypothetical protein